MYLLSLFGDFGEPVLKEFSYELEIAKRYLMFIIPFSIIWFGVTLFGMIAPLKGVWEIKVEEDNITVIKMFIFRRYWKISDISYCK